MGANPHPKPLRSINGPRWSGNNTISGPLAYPLLSAPLYNSYSRSKVLTPLATGYGVAESGTCQPRYSICASTHVEIPSCMRLRFGLCNLQTFRNTSTLQAFPDQHVKLKVRQKYTATLEDIHMFIGDIPPQISRSIRPPLALVERISAGVLWPEAGQVVSVQPFCNCHVEMQ